MGRIRSLIALPAVLALLGLGTGCAGGGFWKKESLKLPPDVTGTTGRPEANAVVPAGGISPLASLPSSLSWITGKTERAAKGGAVTLVSAWQNHIEHLPDPTRDGALGQGLAGQLFVFDQYDQPALLNGSITVDLYDETKREPGAAPNKPERWKFNKDVLKMLRSVDEHFGPSYVLFLPWPTYRPDVKRVRITVMYEPENGPYPIRALESKLTLDPTLLHWEATVSQVRQPPPLTLPSNLTSTPVGTSGATASPSNPGATSGPGMGVIRMGGPRSSSSSAQVDSQPSGIISPIKP
jgi:hypothetical protein